VCELKKERTGKVPRKRVKLSGQPGAYVLETKIGRWKPFGGKVSLRGPLSISKKRRLPRRTGELLGGLAAPRVAERQIQKGGRVAKNLAGDGLGKP